MSLWCGSVRDRRHARADQPLSLLLCRRASGSAFTAATSVDTAAFRITAGAESLAAYESSSQNERVFCSRCGSQLFGRHAAYPIVRMRVGALDDDPGGRPTVPIMTGSKAPRYTISSTADRFGVRYAVPAR